MLSIIFLILGCSSEADCRDDLFKSVQGKLKLVEYFTDYIEVDENGNPIKLTVNNGYEMELKSKNTFISNEIKGFSGGTYAIIRKPGKNLKLVYKNNSNILTMYKYIIGTNENYLNLFYSTSKSLNDGSMFFEWEVLSRMP